MADQSPTIYANSNEPSWGRAIATQALNQFIGQVQTRPLYAHVAKHNIASIRVLQKCGFTICSAEIEEIILKLDV